MGRLKDVHRLPERAPLAYLITVRAYGTWLYGDPRGAVDRDHRTVRTARVGADAGKVASEAGRMRHGAVTLSAEAARVVEEAVRYVVAGQGPALGGV